MINEDLLSLVIVTYNPQKEKLFDTLLSIIKQKNVKFQLVIADDGSKENYFKDIRELLRAYDFSDYKLIENTENKGTVKNFISAVLNCRGKFVKGISPGDYLFSPDILSKWIEAMQNGKYIWSFGDAVYYRRLSSGLMQPFVTDAHPHYITPYVKKNIEQCRYNYLVNDDKCLGASILCHRKELLDYLRKIEGKVIYAEDHIFRLMMFDMREVLYFPSNVIYYEYGEGASTSSNDIWKKKLETDKENSNALIYSKCNKSNSFDKQIIKSFNAARIKSRYKRITYSLSIRYRLLYLIKLKTHGRKTKNIRIVKWWEM